MAITKELQFMSKCILDRTHRLFFDHTLRLNNLMATFLLVSCSNKSSTSIVVVHGQGRKTITKIFNKEIS